MDNSHSKGSIASAGDSPLAWLQTECLPRWSSAGLDHKCGGFWERFHLHGPPDEKSTKRFRVQARQIFVLSHAAATGNFGGGLNQAFAGLDWLLANAWAPDGAPGFVHLLSREGRVVSQLRDTYDQAFAILALAWLARASGRDAAVLSALEQTIGFVEESLALPDGSFLEGLPSAGPRRQNCHMHLFEAYLALAEALDWPGALERASRILDLVMSRMVDPVSKTLGEFFDENLRPVEGPEGRVVEPGHMAEWTWLLARFEDLSGAPADPRASNFLAFAENTALPSTGLLPDATDRFGHVLKRSCRLWPQTERVKAWAARARRDESPASASNALLAWQSLADRFLDKPLPGTWRDQVDASGAFLCTHVQASTLYHIYVAALEAENLIASWGSDLAARKPDGP